MEKIFLMGCMGSGKSTVGKVIAQKLNFTFLDMDTYIENRYRKKISEIFSERGETVFREIERNILLEVSEMQNVVIATGGGTPCFFDNIEVINRSGESVYLKMTVETLCKRLKNAKNNRPVIMQQSDEELPKFIESLLEKRNPYYNQAKTIVEYDTLTVKDLANLIIKKLK